MPRGVSVSLPHPADVHLGFIPLLDAAPLILAAELGYFADEGLQVALHRQVGWGNVRDKLVYGQLHASHALVGMPPAAWPTAAFLSSMAWYVRPRVTLG